MITKKSMLAGAAIITALIGTAVAGNTPSSWPMYALQPSHNAAF
jgi:hypothetical protein